MVIIYGGGDGRGTTVNASEPLDGVERGNVLAALALLAGPIAGVGLGAAVGAEYGVAAFLIATATVAVAIVTQKGLTLARTSV